MLGSQVHEELYVKFLKIEKKKWKKIEKRQQSTQIKFNNWNLCTTKSCLSPSPPYPLGEKNQSPGHVFQFKVPL